MQRKKIIYPLRVNADDYLKFRRIAKVRDLTAAQLLRELIRKAVSEQKGEQLPEPTRAAS